jgi:hypothetical protein
MLETGSSKQAVLPLVSKVTGLVSPGSAQRAGIPLTPESVSPLKMQMFDVQLNDFFALQLASVAHHMLTLIEPSRLSDAAFVRRLAYGKSW